MQNAPCLPRESLVSTRNATRVHTTTTPYPHAAPTQNLRPKLVSIYAHMQGPLPTRPIVRAPRRGGSSTAAPRYEGSSSHPLTSHMPGLGSMRARCFFLALRPKPDVFQQSLKLRVYAFCRTDDWNDLQATGVTMMKVVQGHPRCWAPGPPPPPTGRHAWPSIRPLLKCLPVRENHWFLMLRFSRRSCG